MNYYDFFEELVYQYLTAIQGFVVFPQVPISLVAVKDDKKRTWEACPDFLAVDFKGRCIYIVEVSIAGDAVDKLASKIQDDYLKKVELYVREKILDGELNGFYFKLLLFVRTEHQNRLESLPEFTKVKGKAVVDSLEEVFKKIMSGRSRDINLAVDVL
jgi:hypothetical protein